MEEQKVVVSQENCKSESYAKSIKQRTFGLDLIRLFASLFTIAGHFFSLNTPFRTTTFEGTSMFLQAMGHMFFKGTPFFMLLSGYLLVNKVFDSKYYYRGKKVIIAYLFFSVLTIFFRKYYLEESLSWLQWGSKILDYSAIPYAWYIEMWIGLFLLSPFLNIMYHSITSKKRKQLLLLILFSLSCLPLLTNRYGLYLIPQYWKNCYPLFFYFMGAYIKEYTPVINRYRGIAIILIICLINPVFNLLFVKDHTLIQIAGDPAGAFGVLLSVTLFLLLYKVDISNDKLKSAISYIAQRSLSIYLCCYIFDALYYPWFKERCFISQSQFGIFFFVIVPLVFLSSLVVAQMKEWLFKLFKVIHF